MIKKIVLTIFALIPFAFILLFLSVPSFSSKFNWFSNEPYPVPTIYLFSEDRLYDLVQTWRKENNLSTYIKSEVTCKVASQRLIEVQDNFSHEGFFENTKNNNYYGYSLIGENLAENWASEEVTLKKWLESPKHLENLKKPFTESCIKCLGNSCVHIFGVY